MNRFCIQNAVISKGMVFCLFGGCFCWLITSATVLPPFQKRWRGQRRIAAVTPFEVNSDLALFGVDPDFLLLLLLLFFFFAFFVSVLFCFFIFSSVFSSAPFLFSPCRDLLAQDLGGFAGKVTKLEANL